MNPEEALLGGDEVDEGERTTTEEGGVVKSIVNLKQAKKLFAIATGASIAQY